MKRSIGFPGFTLLELMVAAALTFIFGGAAAVLLGRGLAAWRQTEANLTYLFLIEKGLGSLGEELRNSVALTDQPFEGGQEGLSFLTAEEPIRLARLSYRLVPSGEEKILIRERQPFPPADAAPQSTTLFSHVVHFSIAYGHRADIDGQSTVRWINAWESSPSEIPQLVQIQMESKDQQGRLHAFSRRIRIPHGTVRPVPNE